MAVVTNWTDAVGGLGTAMTYTTIDGVNTTSALTSSIPIPMPKAHVTVFISATATLSANASFDLLGTADGTNWATLVADIIPATTLASVEAGDVSLEDHPAMKYKLQVTTTGDETAKDITFSVVFWQEG